MKAKLLTLTAALMCLTAAAQTESTDTVSTPGYEMLDEIVVQAEKPIMKTDGAKLTYNVDEDPAAGSSNALDILKKVPQISVDGDGNIRLNGSTAFKIQLNGLENPMLKQYSQQIFEGMPASSIVKIEVITEPGAKEDAEGTAGIINIITERNDRSSSAGFSGTASLRVDNRTLTPSVYGLVKKDKFTLSSTLYYQWGFSPQKGEQEMTTTYLGNDPGRLFTKMGQSSKHHLGGGSVNMSWEPNHNNLFTAGVNVFLMDANLSDIYGFTQRYDSEDKPIWNFHQNALGDMKMLNLSANASYRHNFGSDGNYLVLSYLYNFGRSHVWIDRTYGATENYTPDYASEYQGSKTFNRGHTVQADYANNFNTEHHLMEVGVKGIFRHNNALADYTYGDFTGETIKFPNLDSDIMQPQNIYAAYLSYTGNFGKFGVAGGVRYEHTLMGVTDKKDYKNDFRNRLNDVVPNVALTWNFSPSSNLRLAYQMRISRPSIDQVNPFELSFSPYEIRKGNPDLTSERNHIVSLKYSSFGRVMGGTIGLEYNRANNAISGFTYLLQQDGSTVVVTSYANIGKKQDAALTGFFNWNIIKGMNLSVNGRLAYNTLSAPAEGYKNRGWSGNIGANWAYTAAEVYKFSAYGSWFSRNLNIQGYSSGFYYYGISAARDFLADKSLTLSVSANNFLQKSIKYVGHTSTPNVIYDNVGRSLSAWSVGISLSWKFGSLNAQVKKTGVEISNDDINSSSNKNQGGNI